MKKVNQTKGLISALICMTMFYMVPLNQTLCVKAEAPKENFKAPYIPPKFSREELYQDIFVSMMLPEIRREVIKYYSKVIRIPPIIEPMDVFILSIERPQGYRTTEFVLRIEVNPYIGAHNCIGTDQLTIRIKGNEIKIEGYEHIKTRPLPQHYQGLMRSA